MACGVHLLDVNGDEINQVTFQSTDSMSAPLIRLSPDK